MVFFIVLIALLLPLSEQHAQAVVAASQQTQGSVPNIDRKVTLNLKSASIAEAIAEVSKQAGLAIAVGEDVTSSSSKVSLNIADVAARDAIQMVLRGTGLQLRSSATGQLMIGRGREIAGVKKLQGTITGRLTDSKTSKAVSGATVSVDANTSGVMSDEDGAYRLSGISVGTHTISVRLVGYAKQTRQVNVGEGATVTADFKLEPSTSVLNEVVVTGTIVSTELKAVPNAISIITAKQIEERGITRIDQLFRGDIPGLFSLNLGSNSATDAVTMFSRGASAFINGRSAGTSLGTNPIKTYVDGIEMADSKYLSQIDPSSIERIEILAGPQASTIYGSNAINGVMQIFTKRGVGNKPQLVSNLISGIAQNDFNSRLAPSHIVDMRISGTDNKLSYNVGGSWNYIGAWTSSKQTQRLSTNGGVRMDLNKFTADVSARQALTKNNERGSSSQGETNLSATGIWSYQAGRGLPNPRTQTLNGRTLGISVNYHPLSWWSHVLVIGSDASVTEQIRNAPGFSSRTDTTLSISSSNSIRTSQAYSTTMQLPIASLAGFNLTMGIDHWNTKSLSWLSNNTVLLNGNITSPTITDNKPGKNGGAFVQGQLGIKDALFFTYGIRTDWNPNFGDKANVKPGRYGMSYTRDIGSVSAKLRGSYGRSIRPPGDALKVARSTTDNFLIGIFGPFDLQLSNPNLGPEDRRGGEGGVELYFASRASLIVTRFNETTDNLISEIYRADSIPSLSTTPDIFNDCDINALGTITQDTAGHCFYYQYQNLNVGSIRNQGWELQSSINIGPLTTRGTYSWVKSRVLGITPRYRALLSGSGFEEFQPGRPFNFVPEHTWSLGFKYAHLSSMIDLSINGIGMRYFSSTANALGLSGSSLSRLANTRPRMLLDFSNYRAVGKGYTTADLNLSHRFSQRMDALLQVTNLTNYYQNDLSASYASLGRQTRLGLRLRLQ